MGVHEASRPVTRRSPSNSVMRYGRHTLQAAALTQATVVLFSGEDEFHASVRTACRVLGCAAKRLGEWIMDIELIEEFPVQLCTVIL